jgi:hypothetical protein
MKDYNFLSSDTNQETSSLEVIQKETIRRSTILFNLGTAGIVASFLLSVVGAVMIMTGHSTGDIVLAGGMIPVDLYIKLVTEASKQLRY